MPRPNQTETTSPALTSGPSPGSGPASRESGSYARRRAGTACLVCRGRKTKCDNQRPVCGFCAATGGACVYPDDTPLDHSKLDRGSLAILQRLGEMEQNITALLHRNQSSGEGAVPQQMLASINEDHDVSEFEVPDISSQPGPSNTAQPDSDRPPAADVVTRSSEMKVESLLRWPVFKIKQHPSLTSSLGHDGGQLQSATGDGIFDLDPEVIHQLVENFLATNHIKNPIFDVDQLWNRVRGISETGLRWDGATCLVLLICAVSVLSPPIQHEREPGFSRRPERLRRAELYFQMAQRRIGMLFHSNSLIAVQCSFLTAVYLMTTFRIMAAWKAFSQAGTQCVGWLAARGHTREAMDSQSSVAVEMPQGDSEQNMEESLYWSCLKSELELRTELGLPGSSLNEMQYYHVYPSPPSPSQLTGGPTRSESAAQRERDTLEIGWFFYLAEIALRRIMNEALSSRYWADSWYYTTSWWTAEGENRYRDDVERFKAKLETWKDMLPPSMRFPSEASEATGDALRGILRSHLVDILDVLYFPAVRAVACEKVRDLGPYTLSAARSALLNAVYRLTLCEEGFWHRHQGTWLMLRTCSRSLLQLLAVALRAQTEPSLADLLPEGWERCAGRMFTVIEYWEPESPDLGFLLARLKHLVSMVEQGGQT
ncbi:c6 zinc finger domain-containing protein [Dactylonectria estremocensis]|uniref:C6 zinc finger domain-containing protein n=1 Tax=Dactylonectria estremocensis TaxID=1079267 RepID=A0A9P9ECE6_9HYPO|nr:c6 zinc finger domain-containing protein [Dactylonectria estremocensis]